MNRNLLSASVYPMIVLLTAAVTADNTCSAEEKFDVPGAPHLLPEETLFYVRLDNADELREDLANSSIGRMLADPKLKPLATDMFAVAADLFERVSQQAGVSLEEVLAIPSGQVAVAVMPGNPSKRAEELINKNSDGQSERDESEEAIRARLALKRSQQNSFAAVFLVEAGDSIDDLMTLIGRMEEFLFEGGYVRRETKVDDTEVIRLLPSLASRSELEYFVKDGTLVFGVGHRIAQDVLDRWNDQSDQPTLAERSDFANVMSRCIGAEDTRPQVTFFLDPYHLLERAVKRQSMAAFFWPLIEELGLAKFRGVGGSAFRGGEEFESIVHVHILIDPPRDGLFGVLRPEQVDTIPPPWVPADVSGYTTIGWDFAKTYENMGKILDTFQQGRLLKDNVEKPTQEILGISFQDDLLPNFTGRYVNCQWIERPVKLNSQATAHAFELTEPEQAKAALAKFRESRPKDVSIETISGTVVYFFDQAAMPGAERRERMREAAQRRRSAARQRRGESQGGAPEESVESEAQIAAREQFRSGLRKPEPSIVILGNWAVYADSRKFIERIVAASRDSVDRLIEVPDYDLIVSELGGKLDGEKPFLISYLKGADYVRQMYDLAQSPDTRKFLRARAKDDPTSGRIVDLIERDALPPFDEFEIYFAPSGFFAYDEPGGIHFGMFTLRAE